jgi:hypothetical protein
MIFPCTCCPVSRVVTASDARAYATERDLSLSILEAGDPGHSQKRAPSPALKRWAELRLYLADMALAEGMR